MRRLGLCFVESQLTPSNQTLACTATSKLTCTLPKTWFHSEAKQLVCPLDLLDTICTLWTLSYLVTKDINRALISHPVNTTLLLMTYRWNTLINWYDWLCGTGYKMWYVLNIRTKFHAVVNQSVTVRNHTFHVWYCTLVKKKSMQEYTLKSHKQ